MIDFMMMDGLIRSNRDFNLSLISATLYPEYTRDVKFAIFSFFLIPPFFFFPTPVFNATFTAKPIIHLVIIEDNSRRKVIKHVIVASIPYAGRCIYCIDCLRLWVFNYSFSLLTTRIIAADCFKAKENNATTGEHNLDLLLPSPLLWSLIDCLLFKIRYVPLVIIFHWIATN